ncbi:MAG: redox-sensing transcriptional repressor Rex [Lachnospiraceae bacterium]|nr:redox-sensing transcriptional repressor Rex [Lachnospiraceae bacterium]
MEERKISSAVIKRLPRYMRFLSDLKLEGVEHISSADLSRRMKVTASQIRQDLNHFGGFGQQGYGYNVSYLLAEISRILGLDSPHDMVVIGCGNLGRALAGYTRFETRGLFIRAMFDIAPPVDHVRDIPVFPMRELEGYLRTHACDIAILTIPKEAAHDTAHRLYACGIRAFLNFAHLDLALPDDAFVENVHLSDSLMQLTYRLKESGSTASGNGSGDSRGN